MFKKLKNNIFLKNSILYTLGSMMTPMIGFIMLPIYTNYLVPEEYGIMTTIQTIVGMLQLVFLLSLHGSVTRFFYDFMDQPEKQKEYLGSIFAFVLIFSTTVASILLFFSNSIGPILFKTIPTHPYYHLLIGISWVSALFALPMALLRAQEKAGLFVCLNIIKAIVEIAIASYLLIVKGLGVQGVLISQLIVTIIVNIIMYLIQFRYIKMSMNLTYIKQSLMFSIPLLPHVASSWIIKSSDRIILEKFVDITQVGIYALAAQVSAVLALLYTSINSALIPRFTKLKMSGYEKSAEKLLKVFLYIVIIFGIVSVPIASFGILLITSKGYHDAFHLIPYLLFGTILHGLYFIPVAKLFYYKKTKAIAISSSVAAIINIIINLITIPYIGIYGAIISTIVSEIVRLLLVLKASKKIIYSLN
jgi:O-antigen/teichoic acid export membrane protein